MTPWISNCEFRIAERKRKKQFRVSSLEFSDQIKKFQVSSSRTDLKTWNLGLETYLAGRLTARPHASRKSYVSGRTLKTVVENIRSPRSGRQHKAWGERGFASGTPGDRCEKRSKPAERPIVESSPLTFGNCDRCRPLRGLNCFWRP